jgi:hypothetical protein
MSMHLINRSEKTNKLIKSRDFLIGFDYFNGYAEIGYFTESAIIFVLQYYGVLEKHVTRGF